jgi:hypothetical protein
MDSIPLVPTHRPPGAAVSFFILYYKVIKIFEILFNPSHGMFCGKGKNIKFVKLCGIYRALLDFFAHRDSSVKNFFSRYFVLFGMTPGNRYLEILLL